MYVQQLLVSSAVLCPRASQGHQIVFLSKTREWHAPEPEGYRLIRYEPHRKGSGSHQHPYLRRLEPALIEGQAAFRAARELKEQEGWEPDVVVTHVGFGNGLFLGDLFPKARKIGLFEWFYRPFGADVDFLPPFSVSADHQQRLRVWNTEMLQELVSCDFAVVPTDWQRQQFPKCFQSSMQVIHEGVDVEGLGALRRLQGPRPACLPESDIQVLTYVSRCFEAYRGFLMRFKQFVVCSRSDLSCMCYLRVTTVPPMAHHVKMVVDGLIELVRLCQTRNEHIGWALSRQRVSAAVSGQRRASLFDRTFHP